MGSVERKARELLADQYENAGMYETSDGLRSGLEPDVHGNLALRAIAAALREQPEARGVVDAPIEGPRLPSGGSIESKAKAWDEVVNVMDEVCPDWVRRSKVGAWAVCAAIREMAAAQQPVQEGGGERKGCGDPTCGCDWPSFTEPMQALRFLSGRMKYAGIAEGVARSYARDIDDILAKYDTAPPSAPVEAKARAMFEAQADKLAAPWDRQWEPTKRYWREKAHQALTQQPAQAAPGWKLVPVEPTIPMIEAFAAVQTERGMKLKAREALSAMLAAAPTPPGDDAAGGGHD